MRGILCVSEKFINKQKDEFFTKKKPNDSRQTTITQYYLNEILCMPDFTLKRIAEKLDISTTEVIRLYKGQIKNPRAKTFHKLLALYCGLTNPLN